MEFVRSEKGARKLIRNGYIYVYQKDLVDEVTSWECELRRRGQCKARETLDRNAELIFASDQGLELLPILSIESVMVHLKYAQKSFTMYTQSTH